MDIWKMIIRWEYKTIVWKKLDEGTNIYWVWFLHQKHWIGMKHEKQLCKMLRPNFRKKRLVFRKITHISKYFIVYKQDNNIGTCVSIFIGEKSIESELCARYCTQSWWVSDAQNRDCFCCYGSVSRALNVKVLAIKQYREKTFSMIFGLELQE